jgi:hypothetical protein
MAKPAVLALSLLCAPDGARSTGQLLTFGHEGENGPKWEDNMQRTAECHCGQLRAITSGEPQGVYVCHCKACQRRTGAIIHNGSGWLKSQVRIEGEHKIYARIGDSGFELRFHFCPNCGTSLFWEGDRNPANCGIAIGCFADQNFPAPASSGYEEAMHPWLGLPPGIAHFPQSRS